MKIIEAIILIVVLLVAAPVFSLAIFGQDINPANASSAPLAILSPDAAIAGTRLTAVNLKWSSPSFYYVWGGTNHYSDEATVIFHGSPDLINWSVIGSGAWTNFVTTNMDGTNMCFLATMQMSPQNYFFALTLSNGWGESSNSNIAALPPVAVPPQLKIGIGN